MTEPTTRIIVDIRLQRGDAEPQHLQQLVLTRRALTEDLAPGRADYDVAATHQAGTRHGAHAAFADPAMPRTTETWRWRPLFGWERKRSALELVHAAIGRLLEARRTRSP